MIYFFTLYCVGFGMNAVARRSLLIGGWALLLAGNTVAAERGFCANPAPAPAIDEGDWSSWGNGVSNSREQLRPGFTANEAARLKLKWAFGFAGTGLAFAHPTFLGRRIFVGSASGAVYSLDASSGCIYWVYQAEGPVRTAVVLAKTATGGWMAFFGDRRGNAYAIDAATAALRWKVSVDDHRGARITGSPVFVGDTLYVPMSSDEESLAQKPEYRCCTFRGSVTALDAMSGRIRWRSFLMEGPAKPYAVSSAGTEMVGPAGAAIWSSPAVDLKRNVLYASTGNSYTGVDIETSDAIVAIGIDDGRLVWSRQMHPKDNFVAGCPYHPNCPEGNGDDFDFGAGPVIRSLANGSDIILAGQKSGIVYGLNPDRGGEIVWQTRLSEGSSLGGIQWGLAADGQNVYAAVSDRLLGRFSRAGLYALNVATGKASWSAPAPQASGNPAQSAAVSVMPGLVFSGAVNGHLRAYSTATGAIVWDYDTNRSFETVNGVEGHGGSIDGPGPVIAHGMVFTNSGYSSFGGDPGNVLLAFSVDGK
jgi:polyvinyl alcohol dehydrogenase (cytochrome)